VAGVREGWAGGGFGRFDEILAENFLCSNPDGPLSTRKQFLSRTDRSTGEDQCPLGAGSPRAHSRRCRDHSPHQLHHGRWWAAEWPIYRCLGASGRKMASGIGACDAIKMFSAGSATDWQCAVGERIMVYSAATGTPPCSARYHLEQVKTK
jgi:hypothetical protein